MKIKRNIEVRNIGDENVILLQGNHGVDTTKIVSLNETSLWLWNRFIDKDFSVVDVAEALVEEYDIGISLAQKDAQNWVNVFTQNKLIEI